MKLKISKWLPVALYYITLRCARTNQNAHDGSGQGNTIEHQQ